MCPFLYRSLIVFGFKSATTLVVMIPVVTSPAIGNHAKKFRCLYADYNYSRLRIDLNLLELIVRFERAGTICFLAVFVTNTSRINRLEELWRIAR